MLLGSEDYRGDIQNTHQILTVVERLLFLEATKKSRARVHPAHNEALHQDRVAEGTKGLRSRRTEHESREGNGQIEVAS